MKLGPVDLTQRTLMIAEIGANHEGDLDTARKMIHAAAEAGADAVKFQTYQAETIVARTESQRFAHFQRLALQDRAFVELAKEAAECGVLFLSTPFDVEAVDRLDSLVPAFKISSGDLTFTPLLERVARRGKPILLSTGMATIEEIAGALDTVRRAAGLERAALAERVVLLHCVSSYPTEPGDANLRAIARLRETFELPVGYSDHTLGTLACEAAIALGACVIEKHFTLQKAGRTFRDHQLSADPEDLRALVSRAQQITVLLGSGEKTPQASELANRVAMRRSLAARVTIKAGQIIQRDDLICLRPGSGIPPSAVDEVIGRVAPMDILNGHLLPRELLARAADAALPS